MINEEARRIARGYTKEADDNAPRYPGTEYMASKQVSAPPGWHLMSVAKAAAPVMRTSTA
jgi:hypothetical protein